VIVLDTHIWVWWVQGAAQLPPNYHAYIQAHEPQGFSPFQAVFRFDG
jgi:PIN domain nuclease of toxin-antitoxin system